MTCLVQRPQQRGDHAVVLCGEHLRGREQRGLPTAVDDGQHRPHGQHGLAAAHLTLEQPVHRMAVGQLTGDGFGHRALASGDEGDRRACELRLRAACAAQIGRASCRERV